MLETLCDKRALDEMLFRYALALDRRDWGQYRNLLTDDVVFDFCDHGSVGAGTPEFVSGRDNVANAAAKVMAGFDATQHCITNIVHEIAGDNATTRCYLTAEHFLNNDRGDRNVGCGARYEIDARRTGEGWKIAKLRFITLWFRGNTGLYAMAAANAARKSSSTTRGG